MKQFQKKMAALILGGLTALGATAAAHKLGAVPKQHDNWHHQSRYWLQQHNGYHPPGASREQVW